MMVDTVSPLARGSAPTWVVRIQSLSGAERSCARAVASSAASTSEMMTSVCSLCLTGVGIGAAASTLASEGVSPTVGTLARERRCWLTTSGVSALTASVSCETTFSSSLIRSITTGVAASERPVRAESGVESGVEVGANEASGLGDVGLGAVDLAAVAALGG